MLQRAGDLISFFHARAHRPNAGQHQHVTGLDRPCLIAVMASFSFTKTRAGPSLR